MPDNIINYLCYKFLTYYYLVKNDYYVDAKYDIYFIILMCIVVISNYISNILGIYLHINKTDNTLFITIY